MASTSTECLIGKHIFCKSKICPCGCHDAERKAAHDKLIREQPQKKKLKEFRVTALAPFDWPKDKLDLWMEMEAGLLQVNLEQLARRMEIRGVKITVEEIKGEQN